MNRRLAFAFGLGVMAAIGAEPARAQWGYPRGYGGYGMSRWGADPGAGYMAGLGAFARGQGVYQLEKAKADAINVDTMAKWNKALRARQIQLAKDDEFRFAKREAERHDRVARMDVQDGTTLNAILLDILDSDPTVARTGKTATPLSAAAIREIPFEWNSEAITLCLDQMTGEGAMPSLLATPRYEAERAALRAAVVPALEEDRKGPVKPASLNKVRDAVAKFRSAFLKQSSELESGYGDAKDYLTTMDSLSRLLDDPSMKAFLSQLDDNQERTVGDLIAFMNAFNLRFGPATTDRQIQIYERLVPALAAVREAAVATRAVPTAPDADGSSLRSAARNAFRGMNWGELDAHGRAR